MPEPVSPETPSSEKPSSENAPPTAAAGSSQQAEGAALEATGFKWGAEAPAELQGKTPKETLDQYSQLANSVRQYITHAQTQNQQQQVQVAAAAQQQRAQQMADNNKTIADLWFNEPEKAMNAFGSQIQQNLGSQMGQAIAPLYAAQAETAKSLARAEDKDLWNKYGTEIEAMVAGVPLGAKTNPELWKQAARIAKANHLDELVQERASQVAEAAGSGLESGSTSTGIGGGSRSSNPAIERLKESDYGKSLLADYGERGMLDKMRDMEKGGGVTPLEFAERAAKTNVTRNPKAPGQWSTVRKLGTARNVNSNG